MLNVTMILTLSLGSLQSKVNFGKILAMILELKYILL